MVWEEMTKEVVVSRAKVEHGVRAMSLMSNERVGVVMPRQGSGKCKELSQLSQTFSCGHPA